MKYSDIISLRSDFLPVVKVDEEMPDYWRRFIPTTTFENLLQKTLTAFTTSIKHERKSVWVRGTYGTGKSHACSVIKHLLCDDISDISGYIEQIHNTNLKEQLKNKNKKLFPVVIRSTFDGKIKNIDSFNLVVKKRIKEELSKIDANIAVKSDFDQAISFLEQNAALDIEKIIEENSKLKNRNISNKEDIIRKLKSEDVDFFLVLEETLSNPKYSIQLSIQNISEWLRDVVVEIKNRKIADGVLILWDEFPDVIERVQGGLGHIQGIAELTFDNDIYLYLCGPTINESSVTEELRKKTDDRFHIALFGMEAVTTYHIMSATIKKSDKTKYGEFFNEKINGFANLINYLTDHNSQAKKDIQNLFPLHPYSAFLCSAIADQIGSSSRSVFEFLYDKNKGFLSFLDDEIACKEKRLITADYLWEYFLEEFQNDPKKYGIVTETCNAHKNIVAEQGANYEKVFKGILLLNAMRYAVGNRQSEKIIPSTKNIKYLFEGESFENSLDDILEYFHQSSIIRRDPSDNFLIASSSLPLEEINREREKAKAEYSSDIIKILGFENQNKDKIKDEIFGTDLIRQSAFSYLSGNYNESYIRSLTNSVFKESYTLNIALFFSMDIVEKSNLLEKIEVLSLSEIYKNVIFVVFDEVFDSNGSQKRDFIEYVASARAAAKYPNYREQSTSDNKNANQIITNWINRLKQGTARIYFRGEENTINAGGFAVAKCINTNINHKIFSSAVDAMPTMRNTPTPQFWEQKNAKKAAEIMLFAKDRNEAKNNFNITLAKKLLENDIGDWIVEENLELKDTAPDNHPFVLTQRKVIELLDNAKKNHSSAFNIASILQSLTQPPFGLYQNMPNMAVLAFALRKYVNELTENSIPIDNTNMRDKVEEIFKYWKNGGNDSKLRVRFGSEEERKLKDLLIGVFKMESLADVPELTSLVNVRWGVVAFCTQKPKLPLWCLKYSSIITNDLLSLIEKLVKLIQEETIQAELVNKTLQICTSQSFELIAAISNIQNFEEGFKTYIKDISSIDIKDDWWDELKSFLNQTLQGDSGRWQELDVLQAANKFYQDKTRKDEVSVNILPKAEVVSESGAETVMATPTFPNEKINRVKEKVAKTSNTSSNALKNILLQILEKFPQTVDIIDENLE